MNSHPTEAQKKPPFSVFLAATVVIFFMSLSAADSVGLVPDYIDGLPAMPAHAGQAGTAPQSANDALGLSELPQLGDASASEPAKTTLPTRIIIPAIDLDLAIQNPDTRDISALDALLVSGPARYVDSAKLGEVGTTIIFAHSSHLPIVHNQMYKAFNRVPELKAGDTITLEGSGTQYLYTVTDVKQVDATDTKIDMSAALGTRLVLVTCDTLTGKSARYVLEATLIGSYDI